MADLFCQGSTIYEEDLAKMGGSANIAWITVLRDKPVTTIYVGTLKKGKNDKAAYAPFNIARWPRSNAEYKQVAKKLVGLFGGSHKISTSYLERKVKELFAADKTNPVLDIQRDGAIRVC